MLEIRELTINEYPLFQSKTFNIHQEKMLSEADCRIAFGAWLNGLPAGMALFRIPEQQEGNISKIYFLSVFVTSLFRKSGIASKLLEESEQILVEKGFNKITGQYQKEFPMSGVAEKMLEKRGWECEPFRLVVSSHHGVGFLDDPLLKRIHGNLPKDYEYFLWKNISEEESKMLKEKIEKLSPAYNPFNYEDYLSYNSVGLKYKGEVVGWFITLKHHIPNTTNYANMFVFSEHSKKGYGIGLFYETIRLEKLHLGENYLQQKFVAHVYYTNPPMIKLTERKLLKHATELTHYQRATKEIG